MLLRIGDVDHLPVWISARQLPTDAICAPPVPIEQFVHVLSNLNWVKNASNLALYLPRKKLAQIKRALPELGHEAINGLALHWKREGHLLLSGTWAL